MPKGQHKNSIRKTQNNMSPPEPSHLTTALSEHSNIPEAQGKDLKTNFMKMIEVLKEKTNKYKHRKIQSNR